jgi:two-component system chemotaxis response regulator CheY
MRMRNVTLLKELGHDTAEAGDGNQAVEMFKQINPDAVLMDITMPGKDGLQALREILSINPNARIAMVTAMGQQAMVMEAIKAGARDFVVKPFDPDRVKAALKKLVG